MCMESRLSQRMTLVRKKVLFICSRNAARSQMAEGYLREKYGDCYEAFSAGTHPSTVSRYAILVMSEIGIDISRQCSKSLGEYNKKEMDLVVTMCAPENAVCPLHPLAKDTIHITFPDPGVFSGTQEDIIAGFRRVRHQITTWIDVTLGTHYSPYHPHFPSSTGGEHPP